MKLAVFPKYEDLFPGRPIPQLPDILSKNSSRTLLKAFAFINGKVHLGQSTLAQQEEVFWKWITVFDEPTYQSLRRNYLAFKVKHYQEGFEVTLFASSALLKLIEFIIIHFNNLPEKPSQDVADEMALLEAWLINNGHFDLEVAEGTKPEVDNLLGVLLVNQAAQYEFVSQKDFAYQILLAHQFFEFLRKNPSLKPQLHEFLAAKQVGSYQEYLQHLFTIYASGYQGNTLGFTVDQDHAGVIGFFDTLSHDLASQPFTDLTQPLLADPDYKLLRAKPLIKTEAGLYYPLHHNFFVDKFYQGLLFDFYQTTTVRNRLKNFGSFLQYLGQEFAETHLFYQFVTGCFLPKKYSITVPGNRYAGVEYSDYYVRDGNKLFLFEFKNSLVSAQVKQSKDFSRIKEEIYKKLVRNPTNQQDKGVGQLVNVLHKVATGGLPFDDLQGKRIGKLHIFPIIVCTDDFFSLDGVQTIVSDAFSQLLKERPVERHKINDVTIMHLQDIIDIQFGIQTGGASFLAILQEYMAKRQMNLRKKPRSPQELLQKYRGFRPLVQHLVRSYSDPRALQDRLAQALGLSTV